MSRIRSDFWVAAHLRRCAGEGVDAVLRRRGAAEAGAIFVTLDRLDGTVDLFAPVPQTMASPDELGRVFERVMSAATPLDVEARMRRERDFDPDLWWVSIDDRAGRTFLDTVEAGKAGETVVRRG